MKLRGRLVSKPWGQRSVPHALGTPLVDALVGEVIFDEPLHSGHPVMIKYLYTSERLSIQVHPNDHQARSTGHACGKDEMWIVLDAEPGATIGIGLRKKVTVQDLASAIANGSIVDMVDWRPVRRGDVIYNRAGTIHAAGAGLTLLEVQQAADLTYRLYDYGRPRELHVERGLAVSRLEPHFDERDCHLGEGESRILADGPFFGAAWCAGGLPTGVPVRARDFQFVVVDGVVRAAGREFFAGEAAMTRSLGDLAFSPDSTALLTWPVQEALTQAA